MDGAQKIQSKIKRCKNAVEKFSRVCYNTDMVPVNLLNVTDRDGFRAWLSEYHDAEKECWVVVKRGRPKEDGAFWYIDAVEGKFRLVGT